MHFSKRTASVFATFALAKVATAQLPPIHIDGTKFFFENGSQFFMRGIAYQSEVGASGDGLTPGETTSGLFVDPLSDEDRCRRDIPFLAELNTNTIRTYAIDPNADHSGCMAALDEAGIYVISDLGEPANSIVRDNPLWTTTLFDRYKAVVDEMAQYNNVIGFFAGNEVSNDNETTGASAYVKAAVRDTKAYIKSRSYRPMGVGYAANDDKNIRVHISHYFNCGNPDEAIDFWGYNIYSWCGKSTFQKSGYDEQVEFFSNYSVPVFFAEYGCNTVGGAEGRLYDDTVVLYGPDMSSVFSGGIIFKYQEEDNDYGLVRIEGDDVTPMDNFDVLSSQIRVQVPESTASADYTPTNTPQACPDVDDTWKVTGDALPPTPDQSLCDCMWSSLSCRPEADLDPLDYGDIFSFICGKDDPTLCAGITGKPDMGVYGTYVMCNSTQQLGYVLNQYYSSQSNDDSSCSFDGKASVIRANADSTCSDKLSSAAAANAVAATATRGTGNGGNGDSTTGDEEAFGFQGAQITRMLTLGDLAIGAYVMVAMIAGGAMVVL